MQNNKNKGFSIVEVVIALAIFAILMLPIVSSLAGSMKNTTKAKTVQYRNEFTENLMEYAKETPLDDLLTPGYLESIGSFDVNRSSTLNQTLKVSDPADPTGNTKIDTGKEFDTYKIKGSVNLGTQHKKYSYVMEISNAKYAEKEYKDPTYTNPNDTNLGVVEDLDHTKVALINGTIANYDKAVANAFLAKKIEILREKSPEKYEQYISSENQVDIFSEDTASRVITVKVKGNINDGYVVSCILTYHDNSTISLDNGGNMSAYLTDDIVYTPYAAKFDKLPDIYLMYNSCVYNGAYADTDYIVFDLNEMDDAPGKEPEVNVFVVETAESRSSTIADVLNKPNGENLIYDKADLTHGTRERNDVKICMAATYNSKLKDSNGESLLHIYHNFWTKENPNKTGYLLEQTGNNKKNEFIFGDGVSYKYIVKDSNGNDVEKEHTDKLIGLLTDNTKYKALVPDATIGHLNEASQENRGLYTIKIWMSEGEIDKVDTNAEPIITGTKGGNIS